MEIIVASEARAAEVVRGLQAKVDESQARIEEHQEHIDENVVEIGKAKQRREMLMEQAKKATKDRAKMIRNQSVNVDNLIKRYEKHNVELRGLQDREKASQKTMTADVQAAELDLESERKLLQQATDVVKASQSQETTAQKRWRDYKDHLDHSVQDLAMLIESMSLIGRDGDVIEPIAEIVRGHRRLVVAIAGDKPVKPDPELDALVGPIEEEDETLLGDTHEDIGEGWTRVTPAGGDKPYYVNTKLSKSQYSMPALGVKDVEEEETMVLVAPTEDLPGGVAAAAQSQLQSPPHEQSGAHEERRIVLPRQAGGFGLNLNDDGFVLTQEGQVEPAWELREGDKIVAVDGVSVSSRSDIGGLTRDPRKKQVELTIIPWHASGYAPAASRFSRNMATDEEERKFKLPAATEIIVNRRDVFRGVARSALDLGKLYASDVQQTGALVAEPDAEFTLPEADEKAFGRATGGISDLELVKTMGLRNSGLFQREGRNLGPPAWVDGARE